MQLKKNPNVFTDLKVDGLSVYKKKKMLIAFQKQNNLHQFLQVTGLLLNAKHPISKTTPCLIKEMLIFLSSRTPSTLLLTWSPFHCFTSMISISVDYKPEKNAFSDQNDCGNKEPKADLVMLISKGRPFPGIGFELPQQVTLINCISSEEWESASQATLRNTFKCRQALEL